MNDGGGTSGRYIGRKCTPRRFGFVVKMSKEIKICSGDVESGEVESIESRIQSLYE